MNLHDVRRGACRREEHSAVFVRCRDAHVDLVPLEHHDHATACSMQHARNAGKARDRRNSARGMSAASDEEQFPGQLFEPANLARYIDVDQLGASGRESCGKRIGDIRRAAERERCAVRGEHRNGGAQPLCADGRASLANGKFEVRQREDAVADECLFE